MCILSYTYILKQCIICIILYNHILWGVYYDSRVWLWFYDNENYDDANGNDNNYDSDNDCGPD